MNAGWIPLVIGPSRVEEFRPVQILCIVRVAGAAENTWLVHLTRKRGDMSPVYPPGSDAPALFVALGTTVAQRVCNAVGVINRPP